MNSNETCVEVLNDLVRINNDRVEGYQRAAEETKPEDVDLRSLFQQMAQESRELKQQLAVEVKHHGGEVADGTMASGKIYRVWMDVKAAVTGADRKAILSSCEFGEDAAQKTYKMAVETDGLPTHVRELIIRQKYSLKSSHDKIKALRDRQLH